MAKTEPRAVGAKSAPSHRGLGMPSAQILDRGLFVRFNWEIGDHGGLGFLQQKPYFGQQMSPEKRVSSRLEPQQRVL